MAVLGVMATALAGSGTRPKGLYIDGLDVLKQPGSPGNRYGVDIGSIELVEAGPGQISTLSFRIDDPLGVMSIGEGQFVRYQDLTRDLPLFAGWTEAPRTTPLSIGRSIDVSCVGIETLLDWIIIPTGLTINAGTDPYVAVNMLVGGSYGVGYALRAVGTGVPTTQASPLALGLGITTGYTIVVGPCTLRQGLTQLANAIMVNWDNSAITGIRWTVDFWGGLRAWYMRGNINTDFGFGTDIVGLTVAAPTRPPANLQHEPTTGDASHQVYVAGGSAAGTGTVADGSGVIGPIAIVRDTNSTSGASLRAIAQQYFSAHAEQARGEVTCEENVDIGTLGTEIRAGAPITITDAQVGLAAFVASMNRITKRFWPSGTETWTIQYGAEVPSAAHYLRRLTRDQLS